MQPLIELKNVHFSPDQSKNIIQDVSININAGDFIVILGGNGSGKSSLLKLLNQTYKPTQGTLLLKNKSIASYNFTAMQKHVVTLTQLMADSLFLDLTVEENALIIENAYCDAIKKRFSKKEFLSNLSSYLLDFNPNLPKSLKTRVKFLSGGEQQILAFALYLRRQPDLLLLDEPTSALDPKKSDYVMEFIADVINKKHLTCLMTTHQLDYALKYGNRLIAIREGKIVFDANETTKATLSMGDLLQYCY